MLCSNQELMPKRHWRTWTGSVFSCLNKDVDKLFLIFARIT